MSQEKMGFNEVTIDLNGQLKHTVNASRNDKECGGLILKITHGSSTVNTTGNDVFLYAENDIGETFKLKTDPIDSENGLHKLVYPKDILKEGKTNLQLVIKRDDIIISEISKIKLLVES